MKKILIALAGIVVAVVSCSKEAEINTPKENQAKKEKITITVNANTPETKTALSSDRSSLVWGSGDNFRLFTNATGYDPQTLTYSEGNKFSVEVSEGATEAYAYYYAGTYERTDPTQYTAYIDPEQTQSVAGVLNGQFLPMAAKGTIDLAKKEATLDFHQMAGVLALNIYSTEKVSGETIKSVTVTPTANTKFAGSRTSNLTTDNVIYDQATSSSNYTEVKVVLTTAYDYGTTKPSSANEKQMFDGQIYVVLAKQNYSTLSFAIETNKGVYTISGNSFDLTKTDFLPVNINLKNTNATYTPALLQPDEAGKTGYYRVEKDEWLANGDIVAIVAAESDVAMSVTQNNNNRGAASIEKSDDGAYKRLTINDDVQLFELVASEGSGKFAFKCKNGGQLGEYIYAASSSSNYLRSQQNNDANGVFDVKIEDGVATIKATGTNSNNLLRYNSSSSLFSCYASGQKAVSIYKWYDDPNAITLTLDTESLTFEATEGSAVSKSVNATAKNISSWNVSIDPETDFTIDELFDNNSGVIEVTPKNVNNTYSPKNATVTIAATGLNPSKTVSVSQASKVATFSAETDVNEVSKAEELVVLTVTSNIPWALSSSLNEVVFQDENQENLLTQSTYSAPAPQTTAVAVTIPANETGASRTITITVTPNENGSNKNEIPIEITQLGSDKTYTLDLAEATMSNYVASYTSSFTATQDNFTCTFQNFNNNNSTSPWPYVKAGRKNNSSTATITTNEPIVEAIKTVTVTIDAVTSAKINSLKLYVSSSKDFNTKDAYSFTVGTGDQQVTITNSANNCYYQIEADCASGTSNGLITISKIVFSTK